MAAAPLGIEEETEAQEICVRVTLGAVMGQFYEFNDEDGWTYLFDVGAGLRLARARGAEALTSFSPGASGIDRKELLHRYPDLDEAYAMALPMASLLEPVLFVPWKGKSLLVDGWHRLAKSVLMNVETILAYMLTEEETAAIIMARIPPMEIEEAKEIKQEAIPQKFEAGRIVTTPAALESMKAIGADPVLFIKKLLLRHLAGDWGDMDSEDKAANDWAVENGGRILSCYRVREDTTFWLVSEADRSATTVMLPSDY